MLFRLDSSRNPHEICSSNTSNKSNTSNTPQVRVLILSPPKDLHRQISVSEVAWRWRCSHNEDASPTLTLRQTGGSSGHQTRSCPLRFSRLRYTGHYRYRIQPPLSILQFPNKTRLYGICMHPIKSEFFNFVYL